MNKSEIIGCMLWWLVGAAFGGGSLAMGLGTLNEPGPGFFPFLMSVGLFLSSSVELVSLMGKARRFPAGQNKSPWSGREGKVRILLTLIAIFAYVFALDVLGFITTTLVFMLFTLRFVEPQKWGTVIIVSLVTTAVSYVIFEIWLETNLPKGLFGF